MDHQFAHLYWNTIWSCRLFFFIRRIASSNSCHHPQECPATRLLMFRQMSQSSPSRRSTHRKNAGVAHTERLRCIDGRLPKSLVELTNHPPTISVMLTRWLRREYFPRSLGVQTYEFSSHCSFDYSFFSGFRVWYSSALSLKSPPTRIRHSVCKIVPSRTSCMRRKCGIVSLDVR